MLIITLCRKEVRKFLLIYTKFQLLPDDFAALSDFLQLWVIPIGFLMTFWLFSLFGPFYDSIDLQETHTYKKSRVQKFSRYFAEKMGENVSKRKSREDLKSRSLRFPQQCGISGINVANFLRLRTLLRTIWSWNAKEYWDWDQFLNFLYKYIV